MKNLPQVEYLPWRQGVYFTGTCKQGREPKTPAEITASYITDSIIINMMAGKSVHDK